MPPPLPLLYRLQYGFPSRGQANSNVDQAPQGGFWWWNGLPQYW